MSRFLANRRKPVYSKYERYPIVVDQNALDLYGMVQAYVYEYIFG